MLHSLLLCSRVCLCILELRSCLNNMGILVCRGNLINMGHLCFLTVLRHCMGNRQHTQRKYDHIQEYIVKQDHIIYFVELIRNFNIQQLQKMPNMNHIHLGLSQVRLCLKFDNLKLKVGMKEELSMVEGLLEQHLAYNWRNLNKVSFTCFLSVIPIKECVHFNIRICFSFLYKLRITFNKLCFMALSFLPCIIPSKLDFKVLVRIVRVCITRISPTQDQ
mgnify:CR=1 FL=1